MTPRSAPVLAKWRKWRARGVYPSGSYLPALTRGCASFEREDFSGAIEALEPLAGQNERIGGSRAQHDLIEFTLLRAYIEANLLPEAKRLLDVRRPGASGVPIVRLPRCIDQGVDLRSSAWSELRVSVSLQRAAGDTVA